MKEDIFKNAIKYDNFIAMFKKIKSGSKNKREISIFESNLQQNIIVLMNKLLSGEYKFSPYNIFLINSPKVRLILSQNIEDKLVNHVITTYMLMPYIEPKLIDTNIATRKNKGSGYGLLKINEYLNKLLYENKEVYALKMDVSKYFYNIDHNILLNMLSKVIKDQRVINIIKDILNTTNCKYINEVSKKLKEEKIKYFQNTSLSEKEKYNKIYEVNSIPDIKQNRSLPIGNLSSQTLAIFYLNALDHYIKEQLHCKCYIRYMDDILILDTDRNKLKDVKLKIEEKLKLYNLNVNKKCNIYRVSNSFNFLGYSFKIFNNRIIIKCYTKTSRLIIKKLKLLYKNNIILFLRSSGSYIGYYNYCNTVFKSNMLKMLGKLPSDRFSLIKAKYMDMVVIFKIKKYYRAYYYDAFILNRLFKIKIDNNKVWFNEGELGYVLNVLKNNQISCMVVKCDYVVKYNTKVNNYYRYIEEYELIKEARDNINELEKILINNKDITLDSIKKMEVYLNG